MRTGVGTGKRWVVAGLALGLGAALLAGCGDTPKVRHERADTSAPPTGTESRDPTLVPDETLAFSGRVYDETTLAPIAGALVSTTPPLGQITTNGQGSYVFAAPDFPELAAGDHYTVQAERPGYLTATAEVAVSSGHLRNIDLPLTPAAAEFRIGVSPAWLDFTDADFFGEEATTSKQFRVQTVGEAATEVPFSVNVPPADARWLNAAPRTGTVGGQPVFLEVVVDRSRLATDGYLVKRSEVSVVAEGGLSPVLVTLRLGTPPCAACPAGQYCDGTACVTAVCEPTCAGRACGVDGCGNPCGACPAGFVCDDGTCEEEPPPTACTVDAECAPTGRCGHDGLCFPATCATDVDCPAELYCGADGRCYWLEELGCEADAHCPAGTRCGTDGSCTAE